MIAIQKTEYLRSAGSPESFLRDGVANVAFAGRSNVGKSSVINCLTGRKNLARVGSAPGKTSQINYFDVDGAFYLVDLPGYGYARVSQAEKARWAKLMEAYFASDLIRVGVQIVDARHKPTANDLTMCRWFLDAGCPFIVAANKLDKLKAREREENLPLIRQTLELPERVPLIPFSAEKGTGREDLLKAILAMLKL